MQLRRSVVTSVGSNRRGKSARTGRAGVAGEGCVVGARRLSVRLAEVLFLGGCYSMAVPSTDDGAGGDAAEDTMGSEVTDAGDTSEDAGDAPADVLLWDGNGCEDWTPVPCPPGSPCVSDCQCIWGCGGGECLPENDLPVSGFCGPSGDCPCTGGMCVGWCCVLPGGRIATIGDPACAPR
jgi:hypothetical protein